MSEATTGPHKIKVPDTLKSTSPKGWMRLQLNVSTEMGEALEDLAKESNKTVEDILVRAVALYSFAAQSHKEGKHVGTASSEEVLDVEITGF